GAEAVAAGDGRREPAVRGLEDIEVLTPVELRDRILGGRLGSAHPRLRQPREAVGLHQPPRQPETLHAQRVLRPVVEPHPVARMNERSLHDARFQWPDLPPDFSTRWMSAIVTPFSTALTMSYTVRAATLTAVSASISTPVLSTVRTRASTVSSPRRAWGVNVMSTPV